MIDILIEISKVGIRSIFTAKKYDDEILDEDLRRIMFIRNYIEESLKFVKDKHKDIEAGIYVSELKKYALGLFMEQCEEAISDEDKNSEEFNLKNRQAEDNEYFNYVYENLEYPV